MPKRIALAAAGLAFVVMTCSASSVISFSKSEATSPAFGIGMATSDDGGSQTPQIVSVADSVVDSSAVELISTEREMREDIPEISMVKRTERNAAPAAGIAQPDTDEITASIISESPSPNLASNFDIGGPYGGPDCFEGSCFIHFSINTSDPRLIFFRWDFNNDSIWDTPWFTEKSFDRLYLDNIHSRVLAEGWDGISTQTRIILGTNLRQLTEPYWSMQVPALGWKFSMKTDVAATNLGFYQYSAKVPGIKIRLWDFATRTQLGYCAPLTSVNYSWNWCTLASPVNLVMYREYMISNEMTPISNSWRMLNDPDVPWDKVAYQGAWYSNYLGQMPDKELGGGISRVPMVDFRWRKLLVVPRTERDFASIEVVNVSPTPFNVTANPSSALEGSPIQFTAWFNDPGLEDTWEFRWTFDNSTWTPWKEVEKISGGADVLIYHSLTGDITDFKNKIINACGSYCLSVDDYDFGYLGHNQHMSLEELMAYDAIFVETNYMINQQSEAGDLLADYMDQKGSEGSGGVVMGGGPFIANSYWDIRGRYFDEGYSPVEKAENQFGSWNLGTVYVPGHPILDGVGALTSNMHVNVTTLTSGATRIADWENGRIAIATKSNPVVSNGARSVAMPWSSWFSCSGDCIRVVVNALRWASRQPDPQPLTMPFQLKWTSQTFGDDDPVTTSPSDNFTIAVQVRDDDHLAVDGWETIVYSQGFSSRCDNTTFPNGWMNIPNYGWRCLYSSDLKSNAATYLYYHNDNNTSLLISPPVDLGSYLMARVEWRQMWWTGYGGASQDGYVEVSIDNGQTYPTRLKGFHHNNPSKETATYKVDVREISSEFRLRFRIYSHNDWAWIVDDIKIVGSRGSFIWGLGNATGIINVSNVEPSVVGGPSSDTAYVGIPYNFSGLNISDPAVWRATEWFAYRFDFGDGTPAQWVFKGSMSPPKQRVLIIHSMCQTGYSCPEMGNLIDILGGIELVASVETYNFFENLSAPSLSYMLGFDIIMFASNWAYLSFPPYDVARILIGNNLASYLDLHAGGVVTWMSAFDLSPVYGDSFGLLGRYINGDYGPFEKGIWVEGGTYFPPLIENPSHPVMQGIDPDGFQLVLGGGRHSGNLVASPGGLRLASWTDGGAAVGVKDFGGDGRRSCAINALVGGYGGSSASLLLRNCISWVIANLPSPEIPTVSHTWTNPGTYTVDISIIDDDMGWTWDSVNSVPVVDPAYPQTVAHRYIQIDVQP